MVDWSTWSPRETGVLCFIISEGNILLIHKKRGLGAGKVNGPGGRLEPGETPLQAAIRETQEEVALTPLNLEEAGLLCFQFKDGYSLRCHVFRALSFKGTPTETDEAAPFWCPVDEVPYDSMWEDDHHWLPLMLKGRQFHGRFIFDQDRMEFCQVKVVPGESPVPHEGI